MLRFDKFMLDVSMSLTACQCIFWIINTWLNLSILLCKVRKYGPDSSFEEALSATTKVCDDCVTISNFPSAVRINDYIVDKHLLGLSVGRDSYDAVGTSQSCKTGTATVDTQR